jgi:hypothetical protein
MSTLAVNTITDEPGTGAVEFPLMPTVNSNAIIERGSNANGEFVKWADGTMICTKRVTVSTAVASTSGALFWTGSVVNAGATPATFHEVHYRNISIAGSTTAFVAYFTGPSTTSFGSWYHLSELSRPSSSYTYQYVQIGRWF